MSSNILVPLITIPATLIVIAGGSVLLHRLLSGDWPWR